MLADYMTINMLHLLITNSVNEIHRILEDHTQFLPKNNQLEVSQEQERPNEAPQVT